MTPPFSVHDDAELELNEAADFYDLENPGLGSTLIDEFERAVATIREHPEAGPVILGKVRRWGMLRHDHPFPSGCAFSLRIDGREKADMGRRGRRSRRGGVVL